MIPILFKRSVGAMDPRNCTLHHLATHLKTFIESGAGALTPLVFGIGDGGDDDDIKKVAKKTKHISSLC
jgi:hypothetical protein